MNSFNNDIIFSEEKPILKVILDTDYSKDVRIAMSEGTELAKHKTKNPILVFVIEGKIDFKLDDKSFILTRGELLSLEPNIEHSLLAREKSVIRLTIIKV